MFQRVPPNLGHVQYPKVIHLRCTEEMQLAVSLRGGCRWLRQVIAANIAPPAAAAIESPRDTRRPAGRKKRLTRRHPKK
jgi:hypothetical protein